MKSWFLIGASALTLMIVPLAAGQETAEDTEQAPEQDIDRSATVFSLNGQNFDVSDLLAFGTYLLPELSGINLEDVYDEVATLAIEHELAAEQARAAGLDANDDLQLAIKLTTDSILANAFIDQQVSERLTEERVQEAYATYRAEFLPEELATASHILVETEEDAIEAIARLNGGEDFATLAQELSIGPSGPNGGALGTFAYAQMVPAFAQAAFALEPGSFTQAPVQTEFGYHVILLNALTLSEPAPFEALQPRLVQQLLQDLQIAVRTELREAANYIIIPFDDLPRLPPEEGDNQ